MANLSGRKVFSILLLLSYAGLLFYAARSGQPGIWHNECIEYWNHQKWHELTSLAENLASLNKADAESLYLGGLAAGQLGRGEEQQRLLNLFLREGVLNPAAEVQITPFFVPANVFDNLRLFRSRLTLGIVALLILMNFIAFRRHSPSLWEIILPVLGTALLIL